MAMRKTIYLSDDAETKLQRLLEFAQNEPAVWSARTGIPAPTNANQLITQLIHYGYELIVRRSSLVAFAEVAPTWRETSDAFSDVSMDREHYHALLVEEAKRRGVSIYDIVSEWQGEGAIVLPPLEEDPLWRMVGIGASGLGDVSVHHDDYLAETRMARRTKPSDSNEE